MMGTRGTRSAPRRAAKDYARQSFWLETAGDDLTPRPPLDGSVVVDVAILGAGFTGLWTAYYLLRRKPSLRIALVEAEIAGFGASGRNGGWCSPRFSISPAVLQKRAGRDAARDVYQAMRESVDEVKRVLDEEEIDAQFARGGSLRVALGPHHLQDLRDTQAAFEGLGMPEHYRMLDAAQTAARVRIAGAVAGLYNADCAVLHPGRLVRGLARAVERRGATIFEQTRAVDYVSGSSPRLVTPRGDIRAQVVVLAGEAYLSRLRRLRRQVIPIYSQIVLTEPLADAQWAQIGWRERECVHSCRLSVDYLSKTADGRILFGGRGSPYRFGSRIPPSEVHRPTARMLRRMVLTWFPMLRGIRFTHGWAGPIGVARDWMPTFSYDAASGIAAARGYAGQGVSTTNLAGRVLADLITHRDESPLIRLPMVGHRSPDWEPEPLRWLVARYVQAAYRRLDLAAARTGRPPSGRTLAERLARH